MDKKAIGIQSLEVLVLRTLDELQSFDCVVK